MALEYLKVFGEIEEFIEPLTDEQRGRVFSAMMAYAFRDENPDFERGSAESIIWPAIRNKIDGCERKVRQKRANGEKGGRPSKNENKENPEETENNQTEPNETKVNQTEPNETSNEHEHVHEHEQEHEHVQEQEQRENESARAQTGCALHTSHARRGQSLLLGARKHGGRGAILRFLRLEGLDDREPAHEGLARGGSDVGEA